MRNSRSYNLLGMACLAATSGGALAADGPYGSVHGGGNFSHDETAGAHGVDDGNIATLSAGRAFASGFRPELEFARLSNDLQGADGGAGESEANAMLANLWFDLPLGLSRVRPFVGFGAGAADIALETFDTTGAARESSDAVFMYHAGAGMAYDLTRSLALSVTYRYFESEQGEYLPGGASDRYRSEAGLAGLRYTFGGPTRVAAAPASPPQVEVAAFETVVLRTVNFQFDRAELTGPAQATLDELAARLVGQPGLGVLIEGHTDAIGSESYNMNLGERRAEAVRRYLVQRGVDAANLEIVSRGESEPVAPNGTPEGRAANRRAEFSAEQKPADVKIVIEGPTDASIEAADDTLDPGR